MIARCAQRAIGGTLLMALFGVSVECARAQDPIAVGPDNSAGYAPGMVKFFDWNTATPSGCADGSAGYCVGGSRVSGDTYYWTAWLPNANNLPVPSGLPVVGTINDYHFGSFCTGNIGLLQLDTFSWSSPSASHISKINCMTSFGIVGADTDTPVGWKRKLTSADTSGKDGTWKNRAPFSKGGNLYLPVERQISAGDPSEHDATFVMSPDAGKHWCNPYTYAHRAGGPGCDASNWQADGDAPKCGASDLGSACTDPAYQDSGHSSIMWKALPFGTENWYWVNDGYQDGTAPPAEIPNDGCDPSTYACFYLTDGSVARVPNSSIMDVSAWQYYSCPSITQSYRCPGSDASSWTNAFANRTSVIYWSWYGGPFQNQFQQMYTITYLPEFKSYLMAGALQPVNTSDVLLTAPAIQGPWTTVYQNPTPKFPGVAVPGLGQYPGFLAPAPALGYKVLSTSPPHVQMTLTSNSYEGGEGTPLFGLWDFVAGNPGDHIGGANYQFNDTGTPGSFPQNGLAWSFDFLDPGANSNVTNWPFFVERGNNSAVMVPCDGGYLAPIRCGGMNSSHGTSMNNAGIQTIYSEYGGHFRSTPGEMSIGGSQNAPAAMQGNGSYSVVGVYRYEGATPFDQPGGIWSTGDPAGSNNSMIEFNQVNGRLELDWGATSKPHFQYASNFSFPNNVSWYFIAVTVEAQTSCGSNCAPSAKIWVSGAVSPGVLTDVNAGAAYTAVNGATTKTPNVAGAPLILGMNADGNTYAHAGAETSMTNATTMIYNRALSLPEVQAMYLSLKAKMAERGVVLNAAADITPPVIARGYPQANPSTVTGQTTNLLVQATDPTDAPAALLYHWAQTSGPPIKSFSVNDSNAAATTTVTFQAAGTYQFQVTVRDAAGNPSAPGTVPVTVTTNFPANQPPVMGALKANPPDVDGGTTGVQEFEGTTVVYSAPVSDPEGDALSWQWYYTRNGGAKIPSGSPGSATGSGTAQVSFSYPMGSAGTNYVWILDVNDGHNAAVEANLPVSVIAPGSNSLPPPPPGQSTVDKTPFQVKVYPNPWRADKHAASPAITFAGLTAGTKIKIFTASGHLVKDLQAQNPTLSWDLTNNTAEKVASGVYVYLMTDNQGGKLRGKLAVVR